MAWFYFGIGRKSWTLMEILKTFEDAKEIRIGEEDEKMVIEVVLDDKTIRKFKEYIYGYNKFFYEE
jgi:hypothetical protein